jgi:trehalose-6-phosphate synthase
VYLAGQTGWEPVHTYDWEVDRTTYIRLLREYDVTRDPRALAEFIAVINLEATE